MPDVVNRVAPVKSGFGLVSGKAFARRRTIGGSGAAVPGRAGINRVAIRVSQVKGQAMPRLRLQRGLQRVVVGADRVLPVAQTPVVGVQPASSIDREALARRRTVR